MIPYHRAGLLLAALLAPAACAAGLSLPDLDRQALTESARLAQYAYARTTDGGARAEVRGVYCGVAGVLRRADAGLPDGGIACPVP